MIGPSVAASPPRVPEGDAPNAADRGVSAFDGSTFGASVRPVDEADAFDASAAPDFARSGFARSGFDVGCDDASGFAAGALVGPVVVPGLVDDGFAVGPAPDVPAASDFADSGLAASALT